MSTSSTPRDVICSAAYVPRPPYYQLQDSAPKSKSQKSIYHEGFQNYADHQRSWGHPQRSSGCRRQEGARLTNSISSEDFSQLSSSSPAPLMSKRWLVSSGMTRRLREFIPEFKKDREYWQKRFRNNEAAKRSREKRRINDVVMGKRIFELSSENKRLRLELDTIKRHFNLAQNVRFDQERCVLSPKCAAISFVESPTTCSKITTINDDIDDDDSSLLITNVPRRDYDLSRCVETDVENSQFDFFESCPNTVIDQSNDCKSDQGYRRLTSITNIQNELEKFDQTLHATRSNALLGQCYGQALEMNNYQEQFRQNLKQVERPQTCNIECIGETDSHDIPLSLLNLIKRSDYSSNIMTSSGCGVMSVISTSSSNADESGRSSSQVYSNKNDAVYSVKRNSRFSHDEKTGTNCRVSIDNMKNSRLPFNMINNFRHTDLQLPHYDQQVGSRLKVSQVSHDFALELVNISSDEEDAKYALPTSASACSLGLDIPPTQREVPLNLSKRYKAASMNLDMFNDLVFEDSKRSYLNRKAEMFDTPPKSRIVNSSVSPVVSLHSVAPLSTNKFTTSLPPIMCMASFITESRSNDSRDLLPMPSLSRITDMGPLPTISTLTASHARRHLPKYLPPVARDSGTTMNDFNNRIATSKLEDTSGNRFDEGDTLNELRVGEVMNKHVRGGVPLKVWHKLSASVIDCERYTEVTPLIKSIAPSVLSDKCIVGSRVCRQESVSNESIASSSMGDDIQFERSIAVGLNYKDGNGGHGQLSDGIDRVRVGSRDRFETRQLVASSPSQMNDSRGIDPRRARITNDFALAIRSVSQ